MSDLVGPEILWAFSAALDSVPCRAARSQNNVNDVFAVPAELVSATSNEAIPEALPVTGKTARNRNTPPASDA